MIDELLMVLSCLTFLLHICSFWMAHKSPHFVITENNFVGCPKKIVNERVPNLPKMIMHSNNCLTCPVTVNGEDGMRDFCLHLDKTKQFCEIFGLLDVNLNWWMTQFDRFPSNEQCCAMENDKRGFKEVINLGWARHGVLEKTMTSQN